MGDGCAESDNLFLSGLDKCYTNVRQRSIQQIGISVVPRSLQVGMLVMLMLRLMMMTIILFCLVWTNSDRGRSRERVNWDNLSFIKPHSSPSNNKFSGFDTWGMVDNLVLSGVDKC